MAEKRIGLLAELLPHPGETLQELLDTYGMSQFELAQRTGFTTKHINEVIKGKKSITPDMSIKLSTIFNLSSAFWNNLQAEYDSEYNELVNEQTVTDRELEIIKEVPVKELVKYDYLDSASTRNKNALVLILRKFFKVSNLENITSVLENTVAAYRKSNKDINTIKLATWIAMGLNEYRPSANQLNIAKLKDQLPNLKKQILQDDINVAIKNITDILDSCGITFNVIHHLKGVPVQGYIRNTNGKILLNLTIRYKYSDVFWFTLFHEIGHILANKDKKTLNMVDYVTDGEFSDDILADEFAANTLIKKESFDDFMLKPITPFSIVRFAKKESVTPAIVVGRLGHYDNKYFAMFANFRDQFEWA